jgi:DNA-directed RNA polymerase subunit RPC12/RpoP
MSKKKYYCIDCNKEISDSRHKRCAKCSGIKHSIIMSTKCNHFYKDGRTLKTYHCIDCNKKINTNTFLYSEKRCRSCITKYLFRIGKLNTSGKNNAMYGTHKFGKNAPGYIHGMAYKPYPVEWREVRIFINTFYLGKCQLCHKKGNHVHHIDYNKINCNIKNLILLCHKHHSITSGNRDFWFAYFTYIKDNE